MKRLIVAVLLLGASLTSALGQEANSTQAQGMNHAAMAAMMGNGMPTEAGQSAFAAIQEIVGILTNDPTTDWSKVNIEALRQHLIDMDNVTLRAVVTAHEIKGGAEFSVTSANAGVAASIRRMVKAHAATMNGANGTNMSARDIEGGASLVVTGNAVRIRALGFIGIMADGMHHQSHHWMIATGANPHAP